MAAAMKTGRPYQTILDPPPADTPRRPSTKKMKYGTSYIDKE